MTVLLDILSWACLLAGCAFSLIAAVGMIRLPDLFTRMHAAGMIDTAGAGLILLGLALQAGPTMVTVKLALILAFVVFTSPTTTHALAIAALHGGVVPLEPPPERKEGAPSRT